MDDNGLTGLAQCRLCRSACGTCGCRLGGCYTEAWWAEQWVDLKVADEALQTDAR